MQPESLQKAAEAVRSAHHSNLGITADPPRPAHAPPAVRLEHNDIQSFTGALDSATEQWPDSDLCLIGAYGALAGTNIDNPSDTLPDGFLRFLDPEVLLRIPVGDPQDEGDQID